MSRLDDLHAKLAASLNSEGRPIKGYKLRVAALRAEISRLDPTYAAPAPPPDEPENVAP